jgi:hypothetical protein
MVTFSLPEFSSVDRPSLSMDAQSVPWSESNEDSESANAMATQDSTSDPAVPAKTTVTTDYLALPPCTRLSSKTSILVLLACSLSHRRMERTFLGLFTLMR